MHTQFQLDLGIRCADYLHEINVPSQCPMSLSLSDIHIDGHFHVKEQGDLFSVQEIRISYLFPNAATPLSLPTLLAYDLSYLIGKTEVIRQKAIFSIFAILHPAKMGVFLCLLLSKMICLHPQGLLPPLCFLFYTSFFPSLLDFYHKHTNPP